MIPFLAIYSKDSKERWEWEKRAEESWGSLLPLMETPSFSLSFLGEKRSRGLGRVYVGDGDVFLGELYSDHHPLSLCHLLFHEEAKGIDPPDLLDGRYILFHVGDDSLSIFRDPLGLQPLYQSLQESSTLYAPRRRILWGLGLECQSLPPNLLHTHFQGMETSRREAIPFHPYPKREEGLDEATERLEDMLLERVHRLLRGCDRVGVAFSGGVDSALTARLASISGRDVTLFVTGIRGAEDFDWAEAGAKDLGLPLVSVEKEHSDLEEDLPRVIALLEDYNPLQVGVAVPLLWVVEKASERSLPTLLTGQGADELYGGYARFQRILEEEGEERVEEEIYQNVIHSYHNNYERDAKVTSAHGLSARQALISPSITQYVLRLPLPFKLSPGKGPRKILLRRVAEKLGVPRAMAWKRKRAVQYSSHVEKTMRRIAKDHSSRLKNYLKHLFLKEFPRKYPLPG
jgi:asparagine synthase (glutamine-hydrolysing)